ncbi:MAG: hypothetical protein WA051_01230 [Minisyncoccia bacterium]
MNIAEEGKWRKSFHAVRERLNDPINSRKPFIISISILVVLLIFGLFLLEKQLLERPPVRIYQDKSI